MGPLQHNHSSRSTFSISSWQFAGLTANRPLVCHHHSLWFMLSCLPRTHQASCLISLSASGLERFISLPLLLVVFVVVYAFLHFAEVHSHYGFLHLAVCAQLSSLFLLFIGGRAACPFSSEHQPWNAIIFLLSHSVMVTSNLHRKWISKWQEVGLTYGSSGDGPGPWQSPRPPL